MREPIRKNVGLPSCRHTPLQEATEATLKRCLPAVGGIAASTCNAARRPSRRHVGAFVRRGCRGAVRAVAPPSNRIARHGKQRAHMTFAGIM